MEIVYLKKSDKPDKKWMVTIGNKTIHFGAKKFSDYTIHKDLERKERYINRHMKREDWTKSGIKTAGWWSRWLLWSEPSLGKAIKETEKKFNIVIKKV